MSGRHVGLLRLLLVAGLASCVRLQAQEAVGASGEGEIATAPVELDGTVLFHVRGVSSYPPTARARAHPRANRSGGCRCGNRGRLAPRGQQ